LAFLKCPATRLVTKQRSFFYTPFKQCSVSSCTTRDPSGGLESLNSPCYKSLDQIRKPVRDATSAKSPKS
jgi:hypothetical protein